MFTHTDYSAHTHTHVQFVFLIESETFPLTIIRVSHAETEALTLGRTERVRRGNAVNN